jgi:hypothetical protein
MSGYKKFAVVGAGNIGGFITRQLLEEKSAGNINEVVVLTRQVSLVIFDSKRLLGLISVGRTPRLLSKVVPR